MGVNIFTISGLTRDDIELWRNGNLFVDLNDNKAYSHFFVNTWYDEALKDHFNEEPDDHDYMSFDEWCSENELYNAWNIKYWTVIGSDDDTTLVIAIKEAKHNYGR